MNTTSNASPLSPATPLGRLLRAAHQSPGLPGADDTTALGDGRDPFLSVLVRTRGTRATLADTLACLAGQTCDDFEVLLFIDAIDDADEAAARAQLEPFDATFRDRVRVERLRTQNRVHPLNRGVETARGRYVVVLDDDDLVFANWVEDFRQAVVGPDAPGNGTIVRSRAVVQWVRRTDGGVSDVEPVSGFELPYAAHFDLVQHLRKSQTPIHTVALPRSVFSSFGLRFDPDLPVYEDLDLILRAAAWCGVTDTEAITAIYRRWQDAEASINSIPSEAWTTAKARLLRRLDSTPLLLPEGSASALFELAGEVEALRGRVAVAEAKADAFERSRVWRATRPIRALVQSSLVRRLGRRVLRTVRRRRAAAS